MRYPPHLEPFSRDPNQVVILRPFHAEPDGVLQEREKGGGGGKREITNDEMRRFYTVAGLISSN